MKRIVLSTITIFIGFIFCEAQVNNAQIFNASQYFNHISNSHLRGKIRLWKESNSGDGFVSHGLGTEHFYNTYGPGNRYRNTIGHKFYVHGNEVVAQFGVGGGGMPSNRLTSFVNGRFGIGTTAPSHIFHVKTASAVGLFESTTNTAYLRLQNNEGFGKRVEFTNRAGGRASIWVSGAGDAFNVLANGNVGIGTLNPGSYKLAVNGKIRAKEIIVETGWADFVFEKEYKLPTLDEVENHINTNGHLKDIPSAEEVKNKGINLGEMDSKLLQKIEELTLYTIQQEKEIAWMKEELIKLKNQPK